MFGAEGRGLRPLVRKTCDAACLDPARRQRRLAQRQRRGRDPPVRGAAPARCLIRPSTSSTASTFCARASSRTSPPWSTAWRASSRSAAPAAWSSSTASARSSTSGRSPFASRQHADELLERLAAEHRRTERVCLVSSDAAIRSVSGQEVMKRSSRALRGGASRGRAAARPDAVPARRPARRRHARTARAAAPRTRAKAGPVIRVLCKALVICVVHLLPSAQLEGEEGA